jgi:anion-transporting  ArsA/GET3 family ATPase
MDLGLNAKAESLLSRRFQVVAGKGGVGRTLIASALALRSAELGNKTLLLEVNAPDHCARALGVNPVVDTPQLVFENLSLCRMTPAGALREYALMILKFRSLYRLVFENPFMKYFLKSIPSLSEFTMLGKAWFHVQERNPDGSPVYDCVIIDAPATGHAVTFLAVARVVARTVPKGPMKSAAMKMAELVESESDSCLHLVVTPEDMPVNEGLELRQKIIEEVKMKVGLGFMNRMTIPDEDESKSGFIEALAQRSTVDPRVRPYLEVAQVRADRLSHQSVHHARFEAEVSSPILVQDLRTLATDQARVRYLAKHWAKSTLCSPSSKADAP